MESQDVPCDNLPFNENIYFTAAIVDPIFNLRWISVDVTASSDVRDSVHQELTGKNIFTLLFKFNYAMYIFSNVSL